jgi:hypothetical protein
MKALTRELWPIVLILCGMAVEFRHMSESAWKTVLLYNGDSLVLPLLQESLSRGEPYEWVFSSQTFLFPEYPIYWLCALVGQTPRIALTINAIVNVLLLYALFRGIAAQLAPGRRLRQVVFPIAALGIFFLFLLSENPNGLSGPGDVPPEDIASLFLISTYYYGVILTGLLVLLLSIWVTDRFQLERVTRARIAVYTSIVVVLVTATTFSDPLYLLQFAVPFGAAALALAMLRRLKWKWFALLAGVQAIAGAIGLVLRAVFARYIVASSSYISLHRTRTSIAVLTHTLVLWLDDGLLGVLKLLILIALGVLLTVLLVRFLEQNRRGRAQGAYALTPLDGFVAVFTFVSALTLLIGQVATGQLLTRYLVPLFIFPLLGIVLFADPSSLGRRLVSPQRLRPRLPAVVGATMGVTALLAVTLGAVAAPATVDMIRTTMPTGQACFERWIGDSRANGVGSFMVTRPLKLYGPQRGELLQVTAGLGVQPWMNNLSSYRDRHFSFVLVDKVDVTRADTLHELGRPASVQSCPGFQIYDYAGTRGARSLDSILAITLGQAEQRQKY